MPVTLQHITWFFPHRGFSFAESIKHICMDFRALLSMEEFPNNHLESLKLKTLQTTRQDKLPPSSG